MTSTSKVGGSAATLRTRIEEDSISSKKADAPKETKSSSESPPKIESPSTDDVDRYEISLPVPGDDDRATGVLPMPMIRDEEGGGFVSPMFNFDGRSTPSERRGFELESLVGFGGASERSLFTEGPSFDVAQAGTGLTPTEDGGGPVDQGDDDDLRGSGGRNGVSSDEPSSDPTRDFVNELLEGHGLGAAAINSFTQNTGIGVEVEVGVETPFGGVGGKFESTDGEDETKGVAKGPGGLFEVDTSGEVKAEIRPGGDFFGRAEISDLGTHSELKYGFDLTVPVSPGAEVGVSRQDVVGPDGESTEYGVHGSVGKGVKLTGEVTFKVPDTLSPPSPDLPPSGRTFEWNDAIRTDAQIEQETLTHEQRMETLDRELEGWHAEQQAIRDKAFEEWHMERFGEAPPQFTPQEDGPPLEGPPAIPQFRPETLFELPPALPVFRPEGLVVEEPLPTETSDGGSSPTDDEPNFRIERDPVSNEMNASYDSFSDLGNEIADAFGFGGSSDTDATPSDDAETESASVDDATPEDTRPEREGGDSVSEREDREREDRDYGGHGRGDDSDYNDDRSGI